METRPCLPENGLRSPENHITIEPTGNRYCFGMGLLRVLYSWPELGLGSTENRTSGLHCTDPPMIGSSLSLSSISLCLPISLSFSLVISLSLSDLSLSPHLSLSNSRSLSLFTSLSLFYHPSLCSSQVKEQDRRRTKEERREEEINKEEDNLPCKLWDFFYFFFLQLIY
jgi:hypothetical protein